jgi:uncharacterized repeat protein (TIGR03803 family)
MNDLNPSFKLAARLRARSFLAMLLLPVFGAQAGGVLTTLYSFSGNDGANPVAKLVQGSDGYFYGTTANGGTNNFGTVFKISTNGALTSLHSFTGTNDGADPNAGLVQGSDGYFYGTTYDGGEYTNQYGYGYGTVFRISTNGALTSLHTFTDTNNDGAEPWAGLVQGSDGNFYGTTACGGVPGWNNEFGLYGLGTVFKIDTNGVLTTLHSFNVGSGGADPITGLVQGSDASLYGTTYDGGADIFNNLSQLYGFGTVFKISTNGAETTLHLFNGTNDGDFPNGLAQGSDGNFYGTTESGGTYGGADGYGYGIVFKISPNGVLTSLYSFTGGNDSAYPLAGLVQGSDGNFYGTTEGTNYPGEGGGTNGWGTLFRISTNGTLTTLYSFCNGNAGGNPDAALVQGSDGNFYGTTETGGVGGVGTVFRINSLSPVFVVQPTNQVVPAGATISINASPFSVIPLSYQWLFNATNLPGATNATLTFPALGFSNSGTYSLLVTNSYGSSLSSNAIITVVPALVITQPASSITSTGAVLNGSVTLGTDETVAWFELGTDTNYGNVEGETILPGNNGTNDVSTSLSALPGNIYHYRIDAANDFGIVYGNDVSFTVGSAATATTLPPINSINGTTLNATVNPNGWDTTVYFKWGVSPFVGFTSFVTNTTTVMDVGAGATPLNVSNLIPGLSPAQRYAYQVVASNHLGSVFGAQVAFYSFPFVTVPNENWDSVASSADGSVLVAVANIANGASPAGPIIISTNSGASWDIATGAPTNGFWETVACSADGSEMIAAGGGGDSIIGPIYTSADMGVTWVSNNAPVINWQSVASSADGTRLVAAAEFNHVIYTSTNSGAVWTQATNAPKVSWFSVALSADGTKLAAVANGSTNIYTSSDFGMTWITNNVPEGPQGIQRGWSSIASSADGSRLLAVGSDNGAPGFIFISTNSGAAWTVTATNIPSGLIAHPWISVASSADGSKLAAVSDVASPLGVIITSTNSGATWTTNAVPFLDWNAVALSADGAELVATVGYPSTGPIYVSQTTPVPVLNLSAPDNVISWIIPSLDFTLQQSPDLMNWTDVTNQPALNLTNLQNQVTLPSQDGSSFFRLML